MASNKDSGKPVSSEVITTEDDRMPVVEGFFSRLSRFVFRNIWEQKKIESVRKVVREEKGFWADLTEHHKSFNRFKNINRILRDDNAAFEANAIASENRLAEEKRKEAARRRDDLIFERNKVFEEAQSGMRN